MIQSIRERRPAHAVTIKLNRSERLNGKPGFYDGRPVTSRLVTLPQVGDPKGRGPLLRLPDRRHGYEGWRRR